MKKVIVNIIFVLCFLTLRFFSCSAYVLSEEDSSDLYKNILDSIQVLNVTKEVPFVTEDDVYLMAQVVYAESRSEPYEGKIAVASVIINRLNHPNFPKTIKEVITQKSAFSCVVNGEISVVPDASCYSAVLDALKGRDPSEKAVFFYNPKIATSHWMKNINKGNVKTIGNHVFFIVK